MPKKEFKQNAEVVGKAHEFDQLATATGDNPKSTFGRFSRSERICLVVDTEGKVLKESNYLDCLYYCATNTEKALRVEFLQAKIPSFYDRLKDSEALAKQLLGGNAVYINVSAKTLSEALVVENNTLEKISIPNDVLQGPVDLGSIEQVAGNIEKNNPNCVLIILNGENVEDEINSKMDQVCNTVPNNQIRPLYQGENHPDLPMLEDYGFPEEDNEEKDKDGNTEYTNNHQGEPSTTRDGADQGQVIAPTTEEQATATEPVKPSAPDVEKNSEEQYSDPNQLEDTSGTEMNSAQINTYVGKEIPTAISGVNAGWLGRL